MNKSINKWANKIIRISAVVLCFVFITGLCFAKETVKKPKAPYKTKIYDTTLSDSFIIKSKLLLPNIKNQKFPLIIFLHSLGYSSAHWGTIPETFVKQGYAVLLIDLRGHGLSNKDLKFRQYSWGYFTNKTYAKYPKDVTSVLEQLKKSNKKIDFTNYSVIGGDIGASTGVLVASKEPVKPKSMILLTPSVNLKGLELASLYKKSPIGQIGGAPILVMCSKKDSVSVEQELLLKKFATGKYIIQNVDLSTNGMLILKYSENAKKEAIKFVNQNMPIAKPKQ